MLTPRNGATQGWILVAGCCQTGLRAMGSFYLTEARVRRRFQRFRRRWLHDEEEKSLCYKGYRGKQRILQRRIKIAKARSCMDLGQLIESDPWGWPYRMVMKKLRPKAPPLTADMNLVLLEEVIRTLFLPQNSLGLPRLWQWSGGRN